LAWLEHGAQLRWGYEMLPCDKRGGQLAGRDGTAQTGDGQRAIGIEDSDDLLKGHRFVVGPVGGIGAALDAAEGG